MRKSRRLRLYCCDFDLGEMSPSPHAPTGFITGVEAMSPPDERSITTLTCACRDIWGGPAVLQAAWRICQWVLGRFRLLWPRVLVIIRGMKTPQAMIQALLAQGRELLPFEAVSRRTGREFTIDELAREAGTTVRNVRAYQDRGLLAPPERRGRAGVYFESHLARLRVIGQLLERGFTISNIKEMLEAWEQGQDLDHVLGLEPALMGGWSPEAPLLIEPEELAGMLGHNVSQAELLEAVRLKIVEMEGDKLRLTSPQLLKAGAELSQAGVPLMELFQQLKLVQEDTDKLCASFVQLVVKNLVGPIKPGSLPSAEEVARLSEVIQRLRPIAEMVVNAEMAKGLKKHANIFLGDTFKQVMDHYDMDLPRGSKPKPS